MAVEAARLARRPGQETGGQQLFFATSEPAYQGKTNATVIHAALDLDPSSGAFDLVGGARSGIGAVLAADRLGGTAVIADRRSGPAGSSDEVQGGDGAAALAFGSDRPIAELIGVGHSTREYLERWRIPGQPQMRSADPRFVEHVQAKLIDPAVAVALKDADVTVSEVDQVVVAAPSGRSRPAVARAFGRGVDDLADDLTDRIGYAGAAHWAILLTGVLDQAGAGQHIAVVAIGEGVSTLIFQTTSALPAYHEERRAEGVPTLSDQLRSTGSLPYGRFLGWGGTVQLDQPARPYPQPFSPVAAERNARWKFGLVTDEGERLSEALGTVVDVTVDHTGESWLGPVVLAVIEFAGGRQITLEVADVEAADDVRVGDQVAMTFRRQRTSEGVNDYFWKARPGAAVWRG